MKLHQTPLTVLALGTLVATASATPRTSTAYAINAETIDSGGGLQISANYSQISSVATVTGISENSSPVPTVARHGYIRQLYEFLDYALLASDYSPPEVSSTQLIPAIAADDGTYVVIPTTGFTFAALEGPIPAISPTGLVDTATVYEETQAIVGATSPLFAGQLQLTLFVQDTLPDNYSTYAADGLPDAWQRQFFGLDNPLAAPLLDPDGDGQNNRFEYTAGIVPTNPLSRFLLRIDKVPGQPGHKQLTFSPTLPDRSYTVKSNPTLTGGIWEPLSSMADDNQQPVRHVTDMDATSATKFYRVEITKP